LKGHVETLAHARQIGHGVNDAVREVSRVRSDLGRCVE
jgi:hypothetical protein